MEALTVLVAVVALIVAIGLLFSLPVMLLWNGCLVGAINGVNEITWLQAWGILVLCGLLFKTQLSKKD
jgi:Sec-independent protein secretion pathway component TatC